MSALSTEGGKKPLTEFDTNAGFHPLREHWIWHFAVTNKCMYSEALRWVYSGVQFHLNVEGARPAKRDAPSPWQRVVQGCRLHFIREVYLCFYLKCSIPDFGRVMEDMDWGRNFTRMTISFYEEMHDTLTRRKANAILKIWPKILVRDRIDLELYRPFVIQGVPFYEAFDVHEKINEVEDNRLASLPPAKRRRIAFQASFVARRERLNVRCCTRDRGKACAEQGCSKEPLRRLRSSAFASMHSFRGQRCVN
ncbi:hypothetical protein ANO11243_051460 [Dothideomycetidae sp. 11243]|nr:hypothetical protein ANO11243_051460 [fungal sp. No.11243]